MSKFTCRACETSCIMSFVALESQNTLNIVWENDLGETVWVILVWARRLIHESKPALNTAGGKFERRGRLLSREGPTKDNIELQYGKCFCSLSHTEDEKSGYHDLCCLFFTSLKCDTKSLWHPFNDQIHWWGQYSFEGDKLDGCRTHWDQTTITLP